jgi:electron transfer flavoprotein alpha subunit
MSEASDSAGLEAAENGVLAVVGANGDTVAADMWLLEQATRLAAALGTSCCGVTWDADAAADVEVLAAAVAEVARDAAPRLVVFTDDDLGRQLAPMVAADLDTSAVLGCANVLVHDGEIEYVKPVFGGRLDRHVAFAAGYLQVVTLRSTAVAAGMADGPALASAADVVALDLDACRARLGERASHVTLLEVIEPEPQTVDIVHAERIVGVGAGAARDDVLDAAQALAGLLEGAVGATRPVVDDGRLPKERLIGQTGKTVAPEFYLALGISGSPHHVAGIQEAGHVVAVNRDDHAPIHAYSDMGFAGDLSVVLPAVLERIRRWQQEGERDGDA